MRGCTCFLCLGLWPHPGCRGCVKGKMVLALFLENRGDHVSQVHRQGSKTGPQAEARKDTRGVSATAQSRALTPRKADVGAQTSGVGGF